MRFVGNVLFFVGLNMVLQVLVAWRSLPRIYELTERATGTRPFGRYRDWVWERRLQLVVIGLAVFSIGLLLLRAAQVSSEGG